MQIPKIALGSDHAGFHYKQEWIEGYKNIYNLHDFGTYSTVSTDYPDYAHKVASSVDKNLYDMGILLCGSGNGMAITANRYKNIRAALCWNKEIAMLARKHNNANILCVPVRFIAFSLFEIIVQGFFTTTFECGRHTKRVKKINYS